MKQAHFLLLFLIHIFNQINYSNPKTILQIPITFGKGVFQVYINVGALYFEFKLALIDITVPYTYVPFYWNFYSESKTLKVINPTRIMLIEQNITKAIEISEVFQMSKQNGITIDDLKFFLIEVKYNSLTWKQRIGLGFKLENTSLIYQLKDKRLISSLSFSFTHLPNNKRYLNFGGISDDIIKDKYVSKCKVNSQSIEWSCSLNQIIVNRTSFLIKDYAYFSVESKYIYSPVAFFNSLYTIYLRNGFDRKLCKLIRGETFDYGINCYKEYVGNLTDISFIIDGYIYPMSCFQLFECIYDNCKFLMQPNLSSNEWIIGIAFLDLFDTLFDYEQEVIMFYSKSVIHKVIYNGIHEKATINLFVVLLCVIVLLIGLSYEVFILKRIIKTN